MARFKSVSIPTWSSGSCVSSAASGAACRLDTPSMRMLLFCVICCVVCVCLSLCASVSVPVSAPVSMRVCMCTTVSVYVTRLRGAVMYCGRDCGDGVKAIVMKQGDIRAWGGV